LEDERGRFTVTEQTQAVGPHDDDDDDDDDDDTNLLVAEPEAI
jgi:hypothetical protein